MVGGRAGGETNTSAKVSAMSGKEILLRKLRLAKVFRDNGMLNSAFTTRHILGIRIGSSIED